jgi:hypothetical protein
VQRFAWAALGCCAGRGEIHSQPGRPLLLCLARDIELAAGLDDLAEEYGLHLLQSHSAIDLIAIPAVAQVVDLAACRPDEWAVFRGYLEELVALVPDLPPDPELMAPDEPPLLLLNNALLALVMRGSGAECRVQVMQRGANASQSRTTPQNSRLPWCSQISSRTSPHLSNLPYS